MIAATPKAVSWNSDCPVAWRSDGSIRAMVRTTLTMIPEKAIPVTARVATMAMRLIEEGPRRDARGVEQRGEREECAGPRTGPRCHP